MSDFGPPSAARRALMRQFLSLAVDCRDLEARALLYVLDPKYSRSDIATVLSEVEKQKGWRAA